MLPDRYYVAEVHEGPESRRLYFYASTVGLNGPEYGYPEDDSWIGPAHESAVHEVEERLSIQPGVAGGEVTVSASREVSPDELVHQDPWVNVYVVNAIEVAKREIGEALHPIRVIWSWQTSEDRRDEVLVQLRLSDDTGVFGEGFGLQQLRNESVMRDRIRRLYRELLEYRSRSLVMNLLRMKVGTGTE